MEDRHITDLIQTDQEEGIAKLQKDYSGLIHYIVQGILKDHSDIEECVSDVYLKVWKSVDSYAPEKGRFSAWLTVITRNTALNYLKRSHLDNLELSEEMAGSNDLEHEILRREEAETLKNIIRTFSTLEQQIFYRKYYYLQLTATITKEMGLTERSVEC